LPPMACTIASIRPRSIRQRARAATAAITRARAPRSATAPMTPRARGCATPTVPAH